MVKLKKGVWGGIFNKCLLGCACIFNIKLEYAPGLITAFREANKYSKRFVG
jgi:hypothetical protein